MPDLLTIAVAKGRILKETLPLLHQAGIVPAEDPATSRKLILDTNREGLKLVVIRSMDVPTYVEYGAADLGVVGKDVLMEYDSDELYEPLDLNIGRCRMMLAGVPSAAPGVMRMRIATKYPNITRRYFAEKGRQVEIIKLYGSMELAPLAGLADCIVDLVDTGKTLQANGLVPMEHMADISSRLIVNKASMKMKQVVIKQFIAQMEKAGAGMSRDTDSTPPPGRHKAGAGS